MNLSPQFLHILPFWVNGSNLGFRDVVLFLSILTAQSEGTENIIALGTIPLATIEKFSKMKQ
ncbi:hypothetical protein NC651_019469 [Populus alba x Populus x berolinensis]|nr:hypothetical protein NC651_019469 [Populus alba x Populus x berolinensis]